MEYILGTPKAAYLVAGGLDWMKFSYDFSHAIFNYMQNPSNRLKNIVTHKLINGNQTSAEFHNTQKNNFKTEKKSFHKFELNIRLFLINYFVVRS